MTVFLRWIIFFALFTLLIIGVMFGAKGYKQQTQTIADINVSQPVNTNSPTKEVENEKIMLTDIQWEYLAQAYEHYYNKKILKSPQWAERARNHDLSVEEILFLQTELQYRFQQELERQQQADGE